MVSLHKNCIRKCNFNVCLFQKQIKKTQKTKKKTLCKMTLEHNQHEVKSKSTK